MERKRKKEEVAESSRHASFKDVQFKIRNFGKNHNINMDFFVSNTHPRRFVHHFIYCINFLLVFVLPELYIYGEICIVWLCEIAFLYHKYILSLQSFQSLLSCCNPI